MKNLKHSGSDDRPNEKNYSFDYKFYVKFMYQI